MVGYCINFSHNTTKHADYRSEEAAVFDFIDRDRSVQHVVALSLSRATGQTGQVRCLQCPNTYRLPLTSRPASQSIASGLYQCPFFGDFQR